jgi:hypothetical protein
MAYDPPKKGKLRRTPELYAKLMESYRTRGLSHVAAGRAGDCAKETARAAFELGWPEHPWAPPIKTALEAEGVTVRAKMDTTEASMNRALQNPDIRAQLLAEVRRDAYTVALADIETRKQGAAKDKEQAQLQAHATRQEEAELGKFLRARSKLLLGAGSAAMGEIVKLGDLLRRRIALLNKATTDAELVKIDPREVISLMDKYTGFVLKIGLVAQAAQAIDRKAAGDPDFVMLHKQQDMSYDEALKVIESAAETYEANKDNHRTDGEGWNH